MSTLVNRCNRKKKCDEKRPCGRCIDKGLECHYESVKPRKRRAPNILKVRKQGLRVTGYPAFNAEPLTLLSGDGDIWWDDVVDSVEASPTSSDRLFLWHFS